MPVRFPHAPLVARGLTHLCAGNKPTALQDEKTLASYNITENGTDHRLSPSLRPVPIWRLASSLCGLEHRCHRPATPLPPIPSLLSLFAAVISYKDLGPQVGYMTVFIVEYLGPLLIYPLFILPVTRSLIYGTSAPYVMNATQQYVDLLSTSSDRTPTPTLFRTLTSLSTGEATAPRRPR